MMLYNFFSTISDIFGIIGVLLLLVAYYLLSVSKLTAKQLSYQLCNFFGALFIVFSLCFHWNTASFLIETAWVAISIIGICRILRSRKSCK